MRIEREKHLFPPLKAHFKKNGYKVFAEVPFYSSSVDFVAYNGNESIAVEMKMSFSRELEYQGRYAPHRIVLRLSNITLNTRYRQSALKFL